MPARPVGFPHPGAAPLRFPKSRNCPPGKLAQPDNELTKSWPLVGRVTVGVPGLGALIVNVVVAGMAVELPLSVR